MGHSAKSGLFLTHDFRLIEFIVNSIVIIVDISEKPLTLGFVVVEVCHLEK
jgi:hypothetical protein